MRLRSFNGLSLRSLAARPQRTLLTAVGIVLGVGIVFGVITLSDTMSSTFRELYTRAFGAADLVVTAAGGNGTFGEETTREIRETPGTGRAAPRLSVPSSLILDRRREDGLPEVRGMRIFGVEPSSAALATGFELESGRYPRRGAEITLDAASAESIGAKVGEEVTIGTPDGPRRAEVVGLLRIPGGSFGGISFGMAPLRWTQRAFGEPGRISGVAVDAAEGVPPALLRDRLDRRLGAGLRVERSETRTEQVTSQLQGFRISLLFFAGTALFVGAFLVFNALSMTVLERTRELGMLRALGSTRAMIARSVLMEALVLGAVGSLAGLLLGYGMAWGLVYLFGRSFTFEITTLSISPFALLSALAVGVAVTALAALYPALRAGRVSPVEAMRSRGEAARERSGGRLVRLLPPAGLLLAAAGGAWTYHLARNLSTSPDGAAFASGIAAVIGAFLGVSMVVPAIVRPLCLLLSPALHLLFGVEGRMAAANAARNRVRTALTASALMVGISLVIAFAALGGSVLGSIRAYLEDSLGSDYVIQPVIQTSDAAFSERLPERVREVPGVAKTTAIASAFLRSGDETYVVFGLDASYPEIFRVNYASEAPEAFSRLLEEDAALVGRQLAASRGLRVGDEVRLPTPRGPRAYEVAGIVANDVLGGGSGVYLSREALARDLGEREGEFLAIETAPGADRALVEQRVRAILRDYPQFTLYSNAEWKAQIERDFDRQYVFFYAIMGVSVAVSAFGVVNTLSMSVFERTREIGILRAVGASRLQVGRLVVEEGIIISLIGCLLGVAVGSLLGYLFVRGTGAGGFEVSFYYPKLPAVAALLCGLAIGTLAGLLPARTAARKDPVEALQYE
ncbi:membrane protein [Rubrobacter xylanophilus]|uniref:Membrane protein n=1 Tax=Rubrobacter xylanophilus TaxID=49319 RepID=A0A510HEC5_9ACTN|nr:ABC transporter permease [Rubrobacter xylanophilus]BBL78274.1 membrane protein [Rubrobacter xylanophilus]